MSLAALAGGAAVGLLSSHINQSNAKEMAAVNQRYFKENQEQAYQNERKLMHDASALQKSGMVAAGFSPSSLAGSVPATPTVPSAPMGSGSHGSTDLAGAAQLANVESASNLNNAAAEKAKAEAESLTIDNKHKKSADDQFVRELKKQIQDQIQYYQSLGLDTSSLQQNYDNLVENPEFDYGSFVGSMRAMDLQAHSLDQFTHRVEELVKQQVAQHKVDNDSAWFTAQLPIQAQELQEKLISLKAVEAYYMGSGGDLNKVTLEKVAVEIKKLYGEIDNLVADGKLKEAEANRIKNNDIATLLGNGEFGKAGIATGVRTVEGVAKGLGFGAAVGATRGGSLARLGEGVLSHAPSAREMNRMFRKQIPKGSALEKVQKELEKSIGEVEADHVFALWRKRVTAEIQDHKNPTTYENFLKEWKKGKKFMRGY